ncbi:MAG: M23 family metallopeptidase [Peptococcia bacterium]
MKKYIGLMGVLLIVMSLIFPPLANAANLDPSKLTEVEIERERNSHPNDINEKQKALLKAYGVTEDKIKSITRREISNILLFGHIVNSEYIQPYLVSKKEVIDGFKNSEFARKEQALRFEQNGLTLSDLALISNNYTLEEIAKMPISGIKETIENYKSSTDLAPANSHFKIQTITPNLYTRFNKEDINASESGSYVYLHRDSMDTAYSSIATSDHITEVSGYVQNAYTIGKHLFAGPSQGITLSNDQYAYNLFGELTESSSGNIVHEGVDYRRYEGAPVWSLAEGVINNKVSELGGTTVAVYNPFYDVTVIYMHLKNVSLSNGQYVSKDTSFAEQGLYKYGSISNSHVHVELRDGRQTSANPGSGETLSSTRPYGILLWLMWD